MGGVPEVITNGHEGLLVNREDARGLAEAIVELVSSKKTRENMGKRARETARRFDIASSTKRLFELYVDLLSDTNS